MELLEKIPPCIFHYITGLYCPGCGGTRAVIALLSGKVFLSFILHPIVIYIVIFFLVFLCRFIKSIIYNEKKTAILLPSWVYCGALGVVVINFLLKNILLVFFNIQLPNM